MANDLDYYGVINADILKLMPIDAQLIMEVGCASGAMGMEYKRHNKHGRYVGIELNPDAAALAATRLDQVIVGNVESLPDSAIPLEPGKVDVIVYGDVLEHVVDPWSVLKKHARWLSPNGVVVACIPNVAHWSVLVHLIMGEWPHMEQGLFDRTHLRFFTIDSIKKLFASASLQILDVISRTNTTPETEEKEREFLRLFLPIVRQVGLPPEPFTDRSRAFQYVIRARREQ